VRFARIGTTVRPSSTPLQVLIEVTRRCSLERPQSYNNLLKADMEAKRRELSMEEHFRLLDELVEMG
jgi:MoaA/NifB/PqqE/SkfB family radical SAM enzyme